MKGLDFADSRYVRLYTHQTPEWCAFKWEARALYPLLRMHCDRAGILVVSPGPRRVRMLAAMLRMTEALAVVEAGLKDLLEFGWVVESDTGYAVSEFLESETTRTGDRLRQDNSRKNRAALAAQGAVAIGSNTPGAIYVLRSLDGEMVKIGFTVGEVSRRVAQLEKARGERLEVLASFPGTMALERTFHDRFAALRLEGEWFEAAPEILRWASEMSPAGLVTVSHAVTPGHTESPDVTPYCAVPCLTEEKALRELTPPPPAPTSGKSRETSNPAPVQLNALLVPTGAKPAKARDRRKGNPRHRPLLEALMQAFFEATGSAYALAREKDPPAVSALLELAPDEEILRRWRESLTHRNDFLRVSTIAQLRSKWNDLRPRYGMPVLVAQAGGTGSGFRPAS